MTCARAVAAAAVVGVALATPAAAQPSCVRDPFVAELIADGDTFRAVGILKEHEHRLRATDEGLTCARLLLRLYLQHEEHDVADAWLEHMLARYPQLNDIAPPPRLRAEMALLFGNPTEAKRRLGADPTDAGRALTAVADALERPALRPPSADCAAPTCAALRAYYSRPEATARKSPALATVLGIVPGLGQIYASRLLAGIGSLLLHAATGSLALYAASRDERAAALTLGGVTAALYLGNFYAGHEAARRENTRRDDDARRTIGRLPIAPSIQRLTFPEGAH